MMDDEEGPRDWEIKDEEPPERLQKKWEKEEAKGPQTVICPSCKKETPAENLTCVFCATVLRESGPISCLVACVKRLFQRKMK